MNATKQGHQAGQSTRLVVNKATHTTVEAGKTVATAAIGFLKGFLAPADAYVVPKRARKASPTKTPAKAPAKATRSTKAK
jgi:hypothetical protein